MGEQKRKEQREPKFIFTKKNYQVLFLLVIQYPPMLKMVDHDQPALSYPLVNGR